MTASTPRLPSPPCAVSIPSLLPPARPTGIGSTEAATAQANAALHRIVVVRLRHDERTQAYMHRRTTEGMNKAEVIRCLKRYVAREVFSVLRNSALSHSTP